MPIARRLHEDLPHTNAMARIADSTLHRRLPIVRVFGGEGTYFETATDQPRGPLLLDVTPNKGLLNAIISRPRHENRHRHTVMKLLRSGVKTY
jgi:hypothetical protein